MSDNIGFALAGTYKQSVDAKGRITFPSKLREVLGDTFYLSKGRDNCISVYSVEDLEQKAAELKATGGPNALKLSRFLFSTSVKVEADKQGRIVVPAELRDYAFIVKDVSVIGAGDHAEIWERERWDAVTVQLDASIDDIMDEIGF